MNLGDKFEEIVAATIKEFNVFSGPNAKVFQRKVYPGAKDPKGYQIDISIELMLTPELSFLIIIECKDHARPIERSHVQQFIQVRDDISAQKAVIVSAKGFNRGAIRLAESNRIALWQWAKPSFYSILEEYTIEKFLYEMKKKALIKGSILYFHKRGITIEKDSLSFEPTFKYHFLLEDEKRRCDLVLTQVSSNNLLSKNGYMDVDIVSKPRETFFLDIVNTVLESKTSESHELQSCINSQYEKIHQKNSDSTPETTRTVELPGRNNQDLERKKD